MNFTLDSIVAQGVDCTLCSGTGSINGVVVADVLFVSAFDVGIDYLPDAAYLLTCMMGDGGFARNYSPSKDPGSPTYTTLEDEWYDTALDGGHTGFDPDDLLD